MKCSREFIEGYLDEELDLSLRAAIEEHLHGCAQCSTDYELARQQQMELRSLAPYYSAPTGLERSVRKALRHAASASTEARWSFRWRWIAIAACFLLAVSLAYNLSRVALPTSETDTIARNVVSSHVRSLIGTHLLDVISSDRHTVKPWFNGKLDFSPDVRDFAAQGFPLLGGRIDYISDRAVAALVFQRRHHLINVFTWPSRSGDAKDNHFTRDGYNVVQWSNGSMTYWAVSDLSSGEIEQFKQLYMK